MAEGADEPPGISLRGEIAGQRSFVTQEIWGWGWPWWW